MKHFCDLPIPVIREIIGKTWAISEKLDGSYMRAGIDENGRFYTARKGSAVYYDFTDWPDLAWTNYFRSAHIALEEVFFTLQQHNRVDPGDYLDFEVIAGEMPNSINYGLFGANTLWITGGSMPYGSMAISGKELFRFDGTQSSMGFIKVASNFIRTMDGKSAYRERKETNWSIRKTNELWVDPKDFFDDRTQNIKTWLDVTVEFRGHEINHGDFLDLKLNRKPEFITDEDWKANRLEIIAAAKDRREKLRGDFEILCNVAARAMKSKLSTDYLRKPRNPADIEGTVVKTFRTEVNGNTTTSIPVIFKMVDKEHFAPLNNFTHIVRYWLQGGRRPERPSFWSRTQDWPEQKRLDRLEVLRRRYQRGKYSMDHKSRFGKVSYANWDLDQRTLLLFAELKERIQNGRNGIQGQSSSNQQGRDYPHAEVGSS
ncbi:hypothetical protein D3C72_193940 [compost metagenome]